MNTHTCKTCLAMPSTSAAYRAAHNPPGMKVFRPPTSQWWLAGNEDECGPDGAYDTAEQARAAAWAWYDSFTLFTFGATKVALVHAASDYTALSDRAMVEAARPDELRLMVHVSFLDNRGSVFRRSARPLLFNPPLQGLAQPSPEVIRWAYRIAAVLDAYVRMPDIDRYFCNLQNLLATEA